MLHTTDTKLMNINTMRTIRQWSILQPLMPYTLVIGVNGLNMNLKNSIDRSSRHIVALILKILMCGEL
jgi:hypothetical protein